MEEASWQRAKIFLWDSFIRPVYLILNIHQLQAVFLALLIINFVVWKNIWAFWIFSISLGIIFISEIVKYYKSGEFMHNYRDYKSKKGQYRDYRKVTKVLKEEKKPAQEIIIEDVEGDVVANNIEEKNKLDKEREEFEIQNE